MDLSDVPEFPDDVPTAPLVCLSLANLLKGDTKESDILFESCKALGFFYLDLRGTTLGESLLMDGQTLFKIEKQLFALGPDELQRYDFKDKGSYFGYKGLGGGVVDKQGNVDRNEFLNVSKDYVLGHDRSWPQPALVEQQTSLLANFIEGAHSVATVLLNHLDAQVGLPEGSLAGLHRLHEPSGDQVCFIKAPPQPPDDRRTALGEHTDFGSVTILFNQLGGLQVLPPGEHPAWSYVRPLPGHVIVNLGDAMVKFTHGLLRSNLHRVVSPPGAQAQLTRYSLVFFTRPENAVLLRRLEGSTLIPPLQDGEKEEVISAFDWINRRALGRRVGIYKGPQDYEKIRGTESVRVAKL